MRRLVEEYGTVLLYIITGIICIVLFSMAFFGDQSSLSGVINSSIDNTANKDVSVEYNINYNLGEGGTWKTGEIVKYTYTKSEQVILPQPQKEGYLFAGWTGTRLTKPTINVIIPEGSTGDREYTATWTKGYYRIEFDSNLEFMQNKYFTPEYNKIDKDIVEEWMSGETGSMILEYEKNFVLPNSGFVFKGHKFTGWALKTCDATGNNCRFNKVFKAGESYEQSEIIEGNNTQWAITTKTLYAQWEPIVYNIDYRYSTIDYVYSLQSIDSVTNNNPVTYKITDTITLNKATAEGYDSNAWYILDPYAEYLSKKMSDADKAETLNKDGKYDISSMEELIRDWTNETTSTLHNQTVVKISPAVWSSKATDPEKTSLGSEPHDLVLYPLWEAQKYIITYNANMPDYVVKSDLNIVNDDGEVSATILEIANNGDISFSKTGEDYENKAITTKVVFASKYKNLYEGYLQADKSYKIAKGRVKGIPLLKLKLSEVDPAEATIKDNKYKFTGWALDSECKKRVDAETTVSTARDHTLYACWDAVTYKINLHSNY